MELEEGKQKPPRKVRVWPAWASAGLALLLAILYAFRPQLTTAITIWPAWVGMAIGLALALFSRKLLQWTLPLWLIFGFVFVDEFRTVPRGLLPAEQREFRVVTLNCAGGSLAAAREVIPLRPDIVLLQESPNSKQLASLATEMFGPDAVVVRGPDATILARGTLIQVPHEKRVSNFVAARWQFAPGRSLDVVSLRLAPPVLRIDLYSPSAWSEFAEGRARRAAETAEIRQRLAEMGVEPDLIGGDFNTPPDPGSQRVLVGGMDDAFRVAGIGLGATCVNPYPNIVRIDQIWSGPRVRCVRAWVVKAQNSDHRMLVADYRWR